MTFESYYWQGLTCGRCAAEGANAVGNSAEWIDGLEAEGADAVGNDAVGNSAEGMG